MKRLKVILLEDKFRLSGIVSILISATAFVISGYLNPETAFFFFIISYGISAIFLIAVMTKAFATHRWKMSGGKMEYTALLLVLWFISAYSLNKSINVFNNSSTWLSVYICLASLSVILCTLQEILNLFFRHVLAFFLATSTILFIYLALYLIPLYPISIIAVIIFGLSVHTFIPLFLSIVALAFLVRFYKRTPALKYSISAGFFIPVLITIWFTSEWSQLNKSVQLAQNRNSLNKSLLPEWTEIAAHLHKSPITEKYLKADLIYTTPLDGARWFSGNFPTSFAEPKKHDPLVMIASLWSGEPKLMLPDRIKVLKCIYDSRHLAEERLWSGDDLETQSVTSNIKVYPEYRMAYTEKTLSIRNNSQRKWRTDQEAIYTFHLPEGSVVSSLSLWINGREEKARLTTKSKADSAYKTIVGVEVRDPSVVHWQEGNTVSVRVFPCTTEENRKFKIGITSPLKKENDQLIYENTWFEGPTAKNATESVQLDFSSPPKQLDTDLKLQENGKYLADRHYKNKWTLSLSKTELTSQAFSFGGNSYQLKEARSISMPFKPTSIYLDLNHSWSEQELKMLWPHISKQNVYVFKEKLIKVTAENLSAVYSDFDDLNFSLFPFYEIADPENALVISKSTGNEPSLKDLENSKFQERLSSFFAKAKPSHLYQLGKESSPYLKTLKEFRVFDYNEGDIDQLISQLDKHQFKTFHEQDDILVIPNADMKVEKREGHIKSNAPDHLLRLFAYNDILKKVGATYFEKREVQDDLLTAAHQAFIVSPVSSMIVLESQKDYDRFGMKESKNSLKNASIQSSGAAPEPHEWILIILCATIITYFSYQSGHFNRFKLLWK
ncbi:XrtN system VIT domain-containing protein [Pedobacter caeni]|uniref:XrtN system VIT domain protein n=1 Tax=Pedobacter caeni TaxID=288992 RepID=A0A1M5DZ27_9SPHI|nr:XrtN system VIT domain-containing protein [Pedobacter caeni]SHF72190.1 XrtN system VIT domain protein [Pedobacter caeni]